MRNIKYSESFLKVKDKLPPDIKNGVENVLEQISQRDFFEALEFLKRPKIGGARPKIVDDRIHLPQGEEYYHFYTNGFENTYRVLYIVNQNDHSFTFRRIVSPKDHGYIAEVALLDLKSLKYKNYHYISVESKLNAGNNAKEKDLYFDIDDSQKTIIDKLLKSENNYFILGGAGTGKTITAIELFKRAKSKIKDVVYLTFTPNLLKDTKDKLLMSGHKIDDCFTFNEFFLKNPPIAREIHLKVVDDCIQKISKDYPNYENLLIDHHSYFDRNFIYSLIRGFITGGLNPKNNYQKYNLEDTISISRMKALIDLNHLPDEISNQLIEAIILIIKEYLMEKNKGSLYDDNDFESLPSRKPSYIIVDEFQDFTEYQITTILKTSLNGRVDFFGDSQQVINPTFFDIERLRNIIQNIGFKKPEILNLSFNYRSTKELQEFSNHLIEIRKKTLRKNDFNLADSEKIGLTNSFLDLKKNKFSVARLHDKKLIFNLFKSLTSASDTTIIVNDVNEKLELIKEYNLDEDSVRKFIFTIQEYKGLENNNIIIYNLIHENEKAFVELLQNKHVNSKFYEEIFNKLYVAVTRSIKSVILCEPETLDEDIKSKIFNISYNSKKEKFKEVPIINSTEEFKNYIDFSEDSNDYFEAADKFIKNNKLIAGIEKYIQGLTFLLATFEDVKAKDYVKFLKAKHAFIENQKIVSDVVKDIFNNHEVYLEGVDINTYLQELMNQAERFNLTQIYYTTAQLIFKTNYENFNKVRVLEIFENILNWGSLSTLPTLTNFYEDQIISKDESITLNKSTISTLQYLKKYFGIGKGLSLSNFEYDKPNLEELLIDLTRKFDLYTEFYDFQFKQNENYFLLVNNSEFLYEIAMNLNEVDRKVEAINILVIAASKGELRSIYLMGKNHLYGYNCEVDINKAISYFKQAVQQSDYQSAYELGKIYNEPSFVAYDPIQAFELFGIAHKNYLFDASLELAQMYENGIGTTKNLIKAYSTYKFLSERGYAYAESKINDKAFLFQYAIELEITGNNYDSNFKKALQIFESLADAKYPPAITKMFNESYRQSIFEFHYFDYEFGKAIFKFISFGLAKNIRNLHILMISYYRIGDLKNCYLVLDDLQKKNSRKELLGFVDKIDYENNIVRINIKIINYGFFGDKDLLLKKVYVKTKFLLVQRFDLVIVDLGELSEESIINSLIVDKNIFLSKMSVFSKLRI